MTERDALVHAAIYEADQAASEAHDVIYAPPFDQQDASDAIWRIHNALRPIIKLLQLENRVEASSSDDVRDRSGGKASYWLRRAAIYLDCAVQCCGTDDSAEIDAMEGRCDELAARLAEQGR